MKVLCHVHNYPPGLSSGADITAEKINSFLVSKGCTVTVATDDCKKDHVYNGQFITSNKILLGEKYEAADIILTHFLFKGEAANIAARFRKPIFHMMHSYVGSSLKPDMPNNWIIYNSESLKHDIEPLFPMANIVVNPPTFPEDWKNDKNHYANQYVTLVNTTMKKGSDKFIQMAINLPYIKFLGVHGGYGGQSLKVLRNLNFLSFTSNPNDFYNVTKIIVIPSITETWSLVAAEAMASGIPVVCSDLAGLRENCGDAAFYCTNTRQFIDAITNLSYPNVYYEAVAKGYQRASEKNHLAQLENLFNFMKEKVNHTSLPSPLLKEKKEIIPVKEKKIIDKPVSKRKK